MKTLRPRIATHGARANPGGWKPDEVRGSRRQRGYGPEWDRKREQIRARDEGLCQSCLRRGRPTPGTQCDHRIAKAIARLLGWTDAQIEADENLEMKCDRCHDEKTRIESHLVRHGTTEQIERYVAENRGGR